MTLREARRALSEMRVTLSSEHLREVEERLERAEEGESDADGTPGSRG